eukprot:765923-Hanusia_phi.AAC.3
MRSSLAGMDTGSFTGRTQRLTLGAVRPGVCQGAADQRMEVTGALGRPLGGHVPRVHRVDRGDDGLALERMEVV